MINRNQLLSAIITIILICSMLFTACGKAKDDDPSTPDTATADTAAVDPTTPASTQKSTVKSPDPTATPQTTAPTAHATQAPEVTYDPYATENRYDVPASMFEEYNNVDYGTLDKDVTYYSSVAGDNKQVNVLLPAGFDSSKTYPVMYVVHGFDADHNAHLNTGSYLTLLYGNMLHDGLTVPMILVGIDMYTDKLSEKENKSYKELRYIYDKVIDEIQVDLMPFIESNYPVSTDRKDTAVAGVSEGGAKSLCIGFKWLDEFGWIGSFAPDGNVIPTGPVRSYWNDPYMDSFPMPNENNTPYYLYLAVGTEDPWNINCTFLYRDTLNDMGVKNQTDYAEGYGHDSEFWGQCYYNFLSKAFRT